jgi:16S rRNA (uracil1498-N3)-methyltransferase
MHRFYVPPNNINDKSVHLPAEHEKHIRDVLRLKPGDDILVFDGSGKEYQVKIKTLYPVIGCRIMTSTVKVPHKIDICLIQGIAKGDKMDTIIQKGTEIGISRFIPCLTERTIVKLDKETSSKKRERWQKIARSAAEQSGALAVPEIGAISTFAEVIAGLDRTSLNLIPWEEEQGQRIKAVLENSPAGKVNIFIGPEGGFSAEEIGLARRNNVLPVSLGPRILRTETAGLVAAAIIKYEFEW